MPPRPRIPTVPSGSWVRAIGQGHTLSWLRRGKVKPPKMRSGKPASTGYGGVVLGVMTAIARNEASTRILNVRNRGGIAGLTDGAVIELPCLVGAGGAHPLTVPPADVHQLGLMHQVNAFAQLTSRRWSALHPSTR